MVLTGNVEQYCNMILIFYSFKLNGINILVESSDMSSLAATSVLALFWIIGTIRNFPVQEGNTEYFLRTFFLGYIYVIAIVDELM